MLRRDWGFQWRPCVTLHVALLNKNKLVVGERITGLIEWVSPLDMLQVEWCPKKWLVKRKKKKKSINELAE